MELHGGVVRNVIVAVDLHIHNNLTILSRGSVQQKRYNQVKFIWPKYLFHCNCNGYGESGSLYLCLL